MKAARFRVACDCHRSQPQAGCAWGARRTKHARAVKRRAPGCRAAAAAARGDVTVEFPNARGERLVGTLVLPNADARAGAGPSGSGRRARCVLLAHGYMSGRHSELLVRIATALRREGLASLRFDFSGNGDSGGRFKYGHYWCGATPSPPPGGHRRGRGMGAQGRGAVGG